MQPHSEEGWIDAISDLVLPDKACIGRGVEHWLRLSILTPIPSCHYTEYAASVYY